MVNLTRSTNTVPRRHADRAGRSLAQIFLAIVLAGLVSCGTGKSAKKNQEFFTSGSREADQRASQRMAKHEQMSGSNEGAAGKNARKAESGGEGAAAGGNAAQADKKLTLFDRLGGESGIAAIVDDCTTRAIQDPRVNWERKGTQRGGLFHHGASTTWNATPENVTNLQKHMAQFLALATGGPSQYDGKEMKAAHANMGISNPEFDAVVGDMKASLDKLHIPDQEQKELLAIIESTRPQIVTKR